MTNKHVVIGQRRSRDVNLIDMKPWEWSFLSCVGVVEKFSTKMDETKVIYHIDDEDTPYLVKLPKSPTDVRLGDFKNILNRPTYKFFFKSMDDDFG